MLRHVVCLTFRDGTDPGEVAALRAALSELPGRIPEIRSYSFGTDVGLAAGNADFAVVADFDDESGWRAYQEHPDHVRVREEHVVPIAEHRTSVQFEIPA